MNESNLYDLLKSIFSYSTTFQGRFTVLEGYGNDLNADNNADAMILNTIGQTNWSKKYPCVVLMPIKEIGSNPKKNTTRVQLQMYFLTTTYTTGNGAIKNPNIQTNTSKTSIKQDWEQMRNAAGDFRSELTQLFYTNLSLLEWVRPVKASTDIYDRVSLKGNDRLSGVMTMFELDLVNNCTTTDYEPIVIDPVEIP